MRPDSESFMSSRRFPCLVTIAAIAAGVALLLSGAASAADGQFDGVATRGNLSVWRINHGNGAVSLCSFEGRRSEPVCYPWSSGGNPGIFRLIGGDDVLSTWRINGSSGAVSQCEYFELTEPPVCTPWSTEVTEP